MAKIIIISGTPATGKKTVAKLLSKKYKILDVKEVSKKCKVGYDKKLKCDIIDDNKLIKELIKIIKKSKENLVIASHLSHLIPAKYVDLCIITKCDLKVLKKRLEKRKYSNDKIKENLECEIFDICLNEAKEKKHKILIVDTTKGYNQKEILKCLERKKSH